MKYIHTLFRCCAFALLAFGGLACAHRRPETPASPLGAPEVQDFGDAKQELEDHGNYIICRVIGQGGVTSGVKGMKGVFKYARENNRRRVLLDITRADVRMLSVPEIIAGTFGLLPFWDFGTRISVLMPDEVLPTLVDRNSFPVGRIRLIKLRRFNNFPDAEAWLLSDE